MGIRILIVDDHPIVRRGLKAILGAQPGWEVVGEATDGVDAVIQANESSPDIVLLDVSMPRMNGLEACRIIHGAMPGCQILMVSQHDSPDVIRRAMAAGASGYVVKSQAGRDLLTAVIAVSQHRRFVTPPE